MFVFQSFRMRLDFFGARRSDFDAESLEGFSEEFEVRHQCNQSDSVKYCFLPLV